MKLNLKPGTKTNN